MKTAKRTDLQVRGLPVPLRDALRRRALRKGVSMSQYVSDLIRQDLQKETMEEWLEKLHRLPRVELPHPAAHYVHEARREEGVDD